MCVCVCVCVCVVLNGIVLKRAINGTHLAECLKFLFLLFLHFDFLIALCPSEKESTLTEKNFLPQTPFREDPLSVWSKNDFDSCLP